MDMLLFGWIVILTVILPITAYFTTITVFEEMEKIIK